MANGIGVEDKVKLLKACESLLRARATYQRLNDRLVSAKIPGQDLQSSTHALLANIDDVFLSAVRYLDTGKDGAVTYEKLQDVLCLASALSDKVKALGSGGQPPGGIHPDDWAWIVGLTK